MSAKNGKPKAAKKSRKKLTPRRERFVTEAIKARAEDRSMTSAAIAAGYAPSGAHQEAHRLLREPLVLERIERAKRASGVTPEEIIGTLALQMHSDIADLLTKNGEFDYKGACKRGVTGQIKKLKVKDRKALGKIVETTYELELYSAQDAAKSLANIFGLNKQPGVNPSDVQRARAEIDRLVAEGWSEQDAREIVLEAEPRAAEWLH